MGLARIGVIDSLPAASVLHYSRFLRIRAPALFGLAFFQSHAASYFGMARCHDLRFGDDCRDRPWGNWLCIHCRQLGAATRVSGLRRDSALAVRAAFALRRSRFARCGGSFHPTRSAAIPAEHRGRVSQVLSMRLFPARCDRSTEHDTLFRVWSRREYARDSKKSRVRAPILQPSPGWGGCKISIAAVFKASLSVSH